MKGTIFAVVLSVCGWSFPAQAASQDKFDQASSSVSAAQQLTQPRPVNLGVTIPPMMEKSGPKPVFLGHSPEPPKKIKGVVTVTLGTEQIASR